jgi:hypothetical protein
MASCSAAESVASWAERTARLLLEPLGERWRHTQGVAQRARTVTELLSPEDAQTLIAAAWLHDVGYAPALRITGFHAVDGARFVREAGHRRLAGLVAHHCAAWAEAEQRGLADELGEFEQERSLVAAALSYCDLSTDPQGRPIRPADRIADIRRRYGPASPESRALDASQKALLANARSVEALLGGGSGRPLERIAAEEAR